MSFLDLLTSVWLVNSRTLMVLILCITRLISQIIDEINYVCQVGREMSAIISIASLFHRPRKWKHLRFFIAVAANGSCWDLIAEILLTITAAIISLDFLILLLNYRLRFYIFQLMFYTAISPKCSHEVFYRDEMLDIFLCDKNLNKLKRGTKLMLFEGMGGRLNQT